MDSWSSLSMRQRADVMKLAVENGIHDLDTIRSAYNEFAEGGKKLSLYSSGRIADTLWQAPWQESLGEPSHHYDFTQSEEWADAHGYYPDARGHRDDRVKKPAHPSHPSKGVWSKDGEVFNLTDTGMKDPNYIIFGLADGEQDPQATLMYNGATVLPEITITPQRNYYFNSYDNVKLGYGNGGPIHIKPSHRGRLTELKERTGKTEAELYNDGNPAHKKMVVFARSARKWNKHDLGGYLLGQVYDIPEDEVMRLVNAGYEIEYL